MAKSARAMIRSRKTSKKKVDARPECTLFAGATRRRGLLPARDALDSELKAKFSWEGIKIDV